MNADLPGMDIIRKPIFQVLTIFTLDYIRRAARDDGGSALLARAAACAAARQLLVSA